MIILIYGYMTVYFLCICIYAYISKPKLIYTHIFIHIRLETYVSRIGATELKTPRVRKLGMKPSKASSKSAD